MITKTITTRIAYKKGLKTVNYKDCMFSFDKLRAPRQAQQPNKKGLKLGITTISSLFGRGGCF